MTLASKGPMAVSAVDAVFHNVDLLGEILSFHTSEWRKWRDWEHGDKAAQCGHLWLLQTRSHSTYFSRRAMELAAEAGHLKVVQYLHQHRHEGCTVETMNMAAQNGHLCVVQWLHSNRTEGCTARAMDMAAANGHLAVVQWLHENRAVGCTANAMNLAAYNVVAFEPY